MLNGLIAFLVVLLAPAVTYAQSIRGEIVGGTVAAPVGATITVRMAVHNTSGRAERIGMDSWGLPQALTVTGVGPDGRPLRPVGPPLLRSGPPTPIPDADKYLMEPGETMNVNAVLTDVFQMEAPGEYRFAVEPAIAAGKAHVVRVFRGTRVGGDQCVCLTRVDATTRLPDFLGTVKVTADLIAAPEPLASGRFACLQAVRLGTPPRDASANFMVAVPVSADVETLQVLLDHAGQTWVLATGKGKAMLMRWRLGSLTVETLAEFGEKAIRLQKTPKWLTLKDAYIVFARVNGVAKFSTDAD